MHECAGARICSWYSDIVPGYGAVVVVVVTVAFRVLIVSRSMHVFRFVWVDILLGRASG